MFVVVVCFFFNDTATTEIYTLSLHDALPISGVDFFAWRSVAMIFGHWATRGYGLWAVTERGCDDIIGLVGPFYPKGWPETEIGWEIGRAHV